MNDGTATGITLNLGIPILGLLTFMGLCRKESIRPVMIPLFLLFFIYGGCLMVALTSLFWIWSGMASIGAAFLVFVAPIIMAIQAVVMMKRKSITKTHKWIFYLSAAYPVLVGAVLTIAYILNKEEPIKAVDTTPYSRSAPFGRVSL